MALVIQEPASTDAAIFQIRSLGELIAEIYQHIHYYNHNRIHIKLQTSPKQFANQYRLDTMKLI
jgi:hypothetical protein